MFHSIASASLALKMIVIGDLFCKAATSTVTFPVLSVLALVPILTSFASSFFGRSTSNVLVYMQSHEPLFDSSRDAISPKETAIVWWLTRTIVLLVVAAGWLMPEFYDWTGADQSRPAPIVGWIGLGILVADVFVVATLLWLHVVDAASVGTDKLIQADAGSVGDETSVGHGSYRWRFSMFHIFVATTVVAVCLMLARTVSLQVACSAVQAAVAGVGVWVAVQYLGHDLGSHGLLLFNLLHFSGSFAKRVFSGWVQESLLFLQGFLPSYL